MMKLEETILCKNGHENPLDAEFCGECRMPLERDIGSHGLHRIQFLPWKFLLHPQQPQLFAEKKSFILMIAQVIGGITLLIGPFFIWQYIESTKEARTEDKAKTELSNKALKEERYTEAINQLNSQNSVTGRVNAIYNLGKLTSDPDFNDYYGQIINTLVAFIRENSKLKKTGSAQQAEKISDDVQVALKVLGWRRHKFGDGESQRLDLSDTYLQRADLKHGTEPEGAHMEGVLFINANLDHAMLREVNLENAILIGANLRYASLYRANLQNADLLGTDLEGADLQWAKGLTVEQIKVAKNWEKAIFTQAFENELRATH
jgi:hypothetical protein